MTASYQANLSYLETLADQFWQLGDLATFRGIAHEIIRVLHLQKRTPGTRRRLAAITARLS